MKMELAGMPQALERMKQLGVSLERKILKHGLKAGATVLRDAARGECPVRTGKAKRSIKVRMSRQRSRTRTVAMALTSAKDYTGEAFYISFVLYGWRIGKRSLGNARKLQPANDFMKRAFDQSGSRAGETAVETWKQDIDEAMRGK